MSLPFLSGERLYLRPLEESDADGDYPTWLNDGEVSQGNAHHRFPYTREAALEYIRRAGTVRDAVILAMVLHEGDVHIGNISLQRIDSVSRNAEFAILLGVKSCWGEGYGEEAGRLLLDHAFFSLNLHRVYCGTFSTNIGMRRLAEKMGMVEEGCRSEAAFKDGRWLDIVEFGVLRQTYVEKFGGPNV